MSMAEETKESPSKDSSTTDTKAEEPKKKKRNSETKTRPAEIPIPTDLGAQLKAFSTLLIVDLAILAVQLDIVPWLITTGLWYLIALGGVIQLVAPEWQAWKQMLNLDNVLTDEFVQQAANKLAADAKFFITTVVVPIVTWEDYAKSLGALFTLYVIGLLLEVLSLLWLITLVVNVFAVLSIYSDVVYAAAEPHLTMAKEFAVTYWKAIPRYESKSETKKK